MTSQRSELPFAFNDRRSRGLGELYKSFKWQLKTCITIMGPVYFMTFIAQCMALAEGSSIDEAANALFDEYWQRTLESDPETATMVGDHRYDNRLTCHSLKCFDDRKHMLNEFLEKAKDLLPQAAEGSDTEDNLQLFITNVQFKLDRLLSRNYLFPVTTMYNPKMNLFFLLDYMAPKTADDFLNLIARYKAFPQQIEEEIELMREAMRTNFTLHAVSMVSDHGSWKSLEENPFYEPFAELPDSIPDEEKEHIQAFARDAVTNYLVPAFQKLGNFMENEYRPHTRKEIAVSSLPNGKQFYQHELSYHLTDTTVTPEDVHNLGIQEVERIAKEMEEVIKSLGLHMTRKEFSDQLRNNKSQFFNSEEEALETYQHVLFDEITPKLPQYFKIIPKKELIVKAIPEDMSGGPQAYYTAPSPDGTTPGVFYLDTTNLGNLPRYDAVTLAMHEGVPGHHLQTAYAMEQTDVPDFRKYDMDSNAYLEGWGLYSEYLGYEFGLYKDPYTRYGHLSYEIFRACRLVVDTGIHVLGWTRQQAIDYMMEYSASSLNNIEREVDRYVTWPGQACSYKYGELKIKELRRKAEENLGEKFDLKEFHDIVLRNNGPMEGVAAQVDRYIESA